MIKICGSVLFISILISINLSGIQSASWNYKEKNPDEWPYMYTQCAGLKQSPINIDSTQTMLDTTLGAFNLKNFDKTYLWNQTWDGHSIVHKPVIASTTDKLITTGSNWTDAYELLQFHYHWGFSDRQGSEHLLNGVKYPMEIHFVHKNQRTGGLAVLGFFFEISANDNMAINPLIQSYKSLTNSKPTQMASFNLRNIFTDMRMINDKGYYRYSGSLTTPPCSENVVWTVFNYKIPISSKQMMILRSEQYKGAFYRPPQQLYNRTVASSKCVSPNDPCQFKHLPLPMVKSLMSFFKNQFLSKIENIPH